MPVGWPHLFRCSVVVIIIHTVDGWQSRQHLDTCHRGSCTARLIHTSHITSPHNANLKHTTSSLITIWFVASENSPRIITAEQALVTMRLATNWCLLHVHDVLVMILMATLSQFYVSCTNIEGDSKLTTMASLSTETSRSTLSVNNTTITRTPILRNTTFSLGPPRTIMGLSVDVFSFIFLGIAGVAPVVFIVIVVISMKCYTWRKRQKLRKYEERFRTGMELWEAEKRYRFKGKYHGCYDGPAMLSLDEDNPDGQAGSVRIINHKDYPGLTASTSNPNVYFRETALDGKPPKSRVGNGSIHAMPNGGIVDGGVSESRKSTRNGSLRHSINSEERKALECFDKIYESMDASTSTTSSENSNNTGPSSTRTVDGFRYQHPLYPQSSSLVTYEIEHTTPQNLDSIQVVSADLAALETVTSEPTGSQVKPDTPKMSRSEAGNSEDCHDITVHKSAEQDNISKRQSWLYSAYTNVAYVPD